MKRELQTTPIEAESSEFTDGFDLESLLHPAQAFEHPSNVVTDPDLTLNEKRAILASWASDACAVEAVPSLRYAPGGKKPVSFDHVMEALRTLDKQATHAEIPARYRRSLRRDRLSKRSDSSEGNQGHGHTMN
jgi:hypothetical protein